MKRAKRRAELRKQRDFTTQDIARWFSLPEEALFIFEAQDPNIEQYTKVAAAVQNAIQCCVSFMRKKELPLRCHGIMFARGLTELNHQKPMSSASGVSDISSRPPAPVAGGPSAPLSPTCPPPPASSWPLDGSLHAIPSLPGIVLYCAMPLF